MQVWGEEACMIKKAPGIAPEAREPKPWVRRPAKGGSGFRYLQDFSEFFFQVGSAQVPADDPARGIDQEILWDGLDGIELCGGIVPEFEIGHLRPCQAVGVDRVEPGVALAGLVERYAEDGEIFVLVCIISLDHIGIFCPAGPAPGGPEVEDRKSVV